MTSLALKNLLNANEHLRISYSVGNIRAVMCYAKEAIPALATVTDGRDRQPLLMQLLRATFATSSFDDWYPVVDVMLNDPFCTESERNMLVKILIERRNSQDILTLAKILRDCPVGHAVHDDTFELVLADSQGRDILSTCLMHGAVLDEAQGGRAFKSMLEASNYFPAGRGFLGKYQFFSPAQLARGAEIMLEEIANMPVCDRGLYINLTAGALSDAVNMPDYGMRFSIPEKGYCTLVETKQIGIYNDVVNNTRAVVIVPDGGDRSFARMLCVTTKGASIFHLNAGICKPSLSKTIAQHRGLPPRPGVLKSIFGARRKQPDVPIIARKLPPRDPRR